MLETTAVSVRDTAHPGVTARSAQAHENGAVPARGTGAPGAAAARRPEALERETAPPRGGQRS